MTKTEIHGSIRRIHALLCDLEAIPNPSDAQRARVNALHDEFKQLVRLADSLEDDPEEIAESAGMKNDSSLDIEERPE